MVESGRCFHCPVRIGKENVGVNPGDFRALVRKGLDQAIQESFLLPEDALRAELQDMLRPEAMRLARERALDQRPVQRAVLNRRDELVEVGFL